MKRWWVNLLIVGYLAALGYGLVSHVLSYNAYSHIAKYYIIWDMYCGWTAFETRRHVIAEGASGQLYDATPPWREICPYGEDERHHYDYDGHHTGHIAANVLRHTAHEPIDRVYLVEEAWSKKYNLPEQLWKQNYSEPRQKQSYFHRRAIFDPDGQVLETESAWAAHLARESLLDNPRLRDEIARSQPYTGIRGLTDLSASPIQQTSFTTFDATPVRSQHSAK